MRTNLTPEQKRQGAPWKYGIILFWILLVTTTGWFLKIAITSQSELVSTDYYDQGVAFQSKIDQRRAYDKIWPTSKPIWESGHFIFPTAQSAISEMKALMSRPSDQSLDKLLEFRYSESDSTWKTSDVALLTGSWNMNFRIVMDSDTLEQSFKYFIP